MRSRYTAFAVGEPSYLPPRGTPAPGPRTLALDDDVRWTGLDVLATAGGTLFEAEGTVEFRAHSRWCPASSCGATPSYCGWK
jgi:SEC-C motif-containing protein